MRRDIAGLRASLIGLAAGLFMALGGATAAAGGAVFQSVARWDPQTTNVPYLAWVGEEIQLNKCFDSAATATTSLSGVSATFLVEDWSGGATLPQMEPNTVRVYDSQTLNEVCAQGDVVSLYPGMARVELDIVDPGNVLGLAGPTGQQPVVKHQFLAGWMTLNTPTLTEMSQSSFTSSAQGEAGRELGDPTGNGRFAAGAGSGYLDVTVTGSMPMNGVWGALVGKPTVTLPGDWVTLADALATDSNVMDANPAMTWDTSGDNSGLEGHVTPTPPCTPVPAVFAGLSVVPLGQDNVDDCTGGGADGPFSRVFGDLSGAGTSIGPFDPLDPTDTLLSDGALNALDAPMPAARVDVTIAAGGVGYLAAADKAKTYSRDFLGSETNSLPGDEYAPFYDAYIPATSRPGDASSGIDGGIANDFNGFLVDGTYHYWNLAATLGSNVPAATGCLRYSATDDPQADTDPLDDYQTPAGPTDVVVYTDQNGEAQVQWFPGEGFYFNSIIAGGGAIVNANGGCDLQSLYQVPGSLGTATLTATAKYPYKPVDYPQMVSAPVTKLVTSLWSKTLTVYPKGTGAANANARIVVAHAQDIDGTPFAGETACFSANAEGVTWFDGTVGGISLAGTAPAPDPKGPSLGRTCVTTDANGNAAVEVLESKPVTVNVITDFTNEGILRSADVNFGPDGSDTSPSPPVVTGTGTTSSPTPTTAVTATSTAAGSGTTTGATTTTSGASTPPATVVLTTTSAPRGQAPAVISHIRLVRLLTPLHGAHSLLIRVNSTVATVSVRMLVQRRGHRARWQTFRIATNQQVRIAMPAAVTGVKEVFIV